MGLNKEHALTTSYKNAEQIKENIEQVMLDWIALGLDPNKSVLFIQSHVKEELELFLNFFYDHAKKLA